MVENSNMWRFIPFSKLDPYMKTALNDVLLTEVSTTKEPIFWLSGWDTNCINLGVSQEYEKVIDYKKVLEDDVVVTRRQSGGGATFLSKEGEITWGIIVPEEFFLEGINDIYAKVCGLIIDELKAVGIDAYFKPINDIRTPNGKISGATLRKEQGVIYVGGTLLYTSDKELMNVYLKPEEDFLKKTRISESEKKITSISQESSLSFEQTKELLQRAFLKNKQFYEDSLRETEILKAQNLSNKYKSQSWIKYGRTK